MALHKGEHLQAPTRPRSMVADCPKPHHTTALMHVAVTLPQTKQGRPGQFVKVNHW